MTYGSLARTVNTLASHFVRRGVGPGVRVGVCLHRSPALIASILAVLKAGGAYVPLDPQYPAARLHVVVSDADLRHVVTTAEIAAQIGIRPDQVLSPDAGEEGDESEPSSSTGTVSPADPAYVIYTSGSTGTPKGVMVSRANLAYFLDVMARSFCLGPGDVVPALTTVSFDIAGLEMFLPLISGAAVVIVNLDTASDGRRLQRLLESSGATLVQATPTTWRLLLESGWAGDARLTVLSGGEPLTARLAADLLPRCRALWNMYGPTETTVWSSALRVTAVVPGENVAIGQGLPGTTLYVLDDNQQPVANGAIGELYIGGAGVSLGYLNRPEWTGQRFLPDPFAATPDARMYRTGDRVRARDDGTFDFFGRVDHQVKIRGFRVELGEIETALAAHEDVGQAVVILREDADRGPRLAGYVTADRTDSALGNDLRAYLRDRLPAYMVPAVISRVNAFPLTPNGKIDRQALSQEAEPPGVGERAVTADPPRDAIERTLVACWQRVLKTSPIGITTRFFDLGGDSIDAARLFREIHASLGCDLPAAALIQAPTIAQLAHVIRKADVPVGDRAAASAQDRTRGAAGTNRWPALVPVRTEGSEAPLFVVHGGGGTVLFASALAEGLRPGRPVFGLQFEALDGWQTRATTVEELAASYIEAIRAVRPGGPYHIAGFCFGGLVAFEMARQLHGAGDEVGLVALLNAVHPQFDPACAVCTAGPRVESFVDRGRGAIRWRWDYVRESVAAFPHVLRVLAAKACARAGRRIPVRWRADWVYELTDNAALVYRPQQYDGPVTIVAGRDLYADPMLGWDKVSRDAEVIEIGSPQRLRRDLVRPPTVRELAAVLEERLAAADSETEIRRAS